jgi:hypothetical protein
LWSKVQIAQLGQPRVLISSGLFVCIRIKVARFGGNFNRKGELDILMR